MRWLPTLLALGLPFSAWGQVALTSSPTEYYNWEYQADFRTRYQAESAIQGAGAFNALSYRLGVRGGGPMTRDLRVFVDANYTHTRYDFGSAAPAGCSNPAACFRNKPWEEIHRVDIAPGAGLSFADDFEFQLSVPIRWNAEENSEENAVTAGAIVHLQWKPTDRLKAGVGVGVQNELDEDLSIFPVLSLDWQFADHARLVTRGGGYQGGEIALIWNPSDVFEGTLSGGYEKTRFRLSDSGPNPRGVGESTSAPLLARMDIAITPQLHFFAEGGIVVAGQLRIEDANGQRLSQQNYDTAGVISGSCRLYF